MQNNRDGLNVAKGRISSVDQISNCEKYYNLLPNSYLYEQRFLIVQ